MLNVTFIIPATRIPINEKYERYCIKAGSRWPWTYVKRKDEKIQKPPFPFYLAYSASIIKNLGFNVNVIDGSALDLNDEELIQKIIQINPDIIVSETTTHSIDYDISFYIKLKKQINKFILILTGSHVTVFCEELLKKYDIIDFIIRGEYEFALRDLILALNNNHDFSNIKGLAFKKKNGDILISNQIYNVEPLDDLPYPLYEMFPEKGKNFTDYYCDGQLLYKPGAVMHSSRGCPFGCDFCVWPQVMYGNRKYRMFSPKRVVDEMEYLIKNYNVKEIYFDDDDFCINKKHVLEICNEIKKRNLKIKWSIMGDAIACDLEMLKEMKSAGLISMKFGVESGNPQILKNIGKPLNLDYVKKFAKEAWNLGIFTHATFSLGLTGETKETLNDTLKFALSIPFDYAQVSITTPFPGTKFYQKMVENGAIKSSDWSKYDGTIFSVISQNDITPEYLINFKKFFIKKLILKKIINLRWWFRFFKKQFIILKNNGLSPLFNLIIHTIRFFTLNLNKN